MTTTDTPTLDLDTQIFESQFLEGFLEILHKYAPSFTPIPSEHGTSVPTTPRLFKAGDVVEYRPKDGRANPNLLVGRRYKVSVDEPCDSGIVQVEFDGLRHIDTFVAYNNLELITPVEEMMPYTVDECGFAPTLYVRKNGKVYMTIPYKEDSSLFQTHEEALAAAEAECKRLNAEYRKEAANG